VQGNWQDALQLMRLLLRLQPGSMQRYSGGMHRQQHFALLQQQQQLPPQHHFQPEMPPWMPPRGAAPGHPQLPRQQDCGGMQSVEAMERLTALLTAGPPVRMNSATVVAMMDGALARSEANIAVDSFRAGVDAGVVPDVALVNALLRALAQLGEWLHAREVLINAWRGVGIDLASVHILSDLLQAVCVIVADDTAGCVQEQVHNMMDEVRTPAHFRGRVRCVRFAC
jgi:hypothetical protein